MTTPQEETDLEKTLIDWAAAYGVFALSSASGSMDALVQLIKARDEQREKQLFTPQQVDSLVAQAEWQLLDELKVAVDDCYLVMQGNEMVHKANIDSFVRSKRQSLTNPQEQDNAPNITTHPDGTVEIIVHKEEE